MTEQLLKTPLATFKALDKMPQRGDANNKQVKKVGKKRGRPPKLSNQSMILSSAVKPKSKRGRKHLKENQIIKIKGRILDFLQASPNSSRQQIMKATRIPTAGIYNRIMGELKDTKQMVSKGSKKRVVYFLK